MREYYFLSSVFFVPGNHYFLLTIIDIEWRLKSEYLLKSQKGYDVYLLFFLGSFCLKRGVGWLEYAYFYTLKRQLFADIESEIKTPNFRMILKLGALLYEVRYYLETVLFLKVDTSTTS